MNPPFEQPTIHIARAADAAAMAAMSRDLIEHGLVWKYTASRIAELISDPQTVALVARLGAGPGSLPHGMAIMRFADEQAHLVLLCVQARQQRRGLGRQLLDWLLKSARVAGMAELHLELRADNAPALGFYRGFGFTETRRVPDYYDRGVDAQCMVLTLRWPVAQG